MILAPTGRDAALTASTLEKAGLKSRICGSLTELCQQIRLGAGAATIAQEALTPDSGQLFADALCDQPAWSDFPLLISTVNGALASQHQLTDGFLSQFGNVTLLERPMRLQTMLSAVRTALRTRRRQYQARDLILQRERTLARLEIVAEVSANLLTSDKPETILDKVFVKLSHQLDLDVYLAYVLDAESNTLQLTAFSGIPDAAAKDIVSVTLGQLGYEQSETVQRVMKERFSLLDENADWLRSLGVTAFATYPLCGKSQIVGALAFGSRKRTHFEHDELGLMETVCNQVAVAMERRRVEEQLKNFNQVLEERVRERTGALKEVNDQMEAFIYSVSHDLRAPLRAMISFSDILLTSYRDKLDDEGCEYLQRISKSSRYMDSLTNDLLHYSRLSRWDFVQSEVDLEACVATVLYNFHSEIERCKAKIDIKKPLPVLLAHSGPLEQIVSNLVSNALKFCRKGCPPTIRIWTEDHHPWVRVWIADDGIGIEQQYFERIFRMFERLHGASAYPGTGMGLAIVKKAVERMGGRVGVESKPGEGTRFWFELPKPPVADVSPEPKNRLATA